jgi:hypothetical protein
MPRPSLTSTNVGAGRRMRRPYEESSTVCRGTLRQALKRRGRRRSLLALLRTSGGARSDICAREAAGAGEESGERRARHPPSGRKKYETSQAPQRRTGTHIS